MIGKPAKSPTKKPCVIPEKVLQAQVESYLRLKRIPYLRIPDGVYKSIRKMGKKDAGQTASAVTGWPDITLFKVSADGSLRALAIELKSAKGIFEPGSKEMASAFGHQSRAVI